MIIAIKILITSIIILVIMSRLTPSEYEIPTVLDTAIAMVGASSFIIGVCSLLYMIWEL